MTVDKFDDSDFEPISSPKTNNLSVDDKSPLAFDDSDFEVIEPAKEIVNPDIQPQIPQSNQPVIPQDTGVGSEYARDPKRLVEGGMAALGTLGDVGLDLAKGAADVTAWILDKVNVINPETASTFYKATEYGADQLRPSKNAPFKEYMDASPVLTSVGRAVGDVYGMTRGQGALGKGLIPQTALGGAISTAMGTDEQVGTFGDTPLTEKDLFGIIGAAGQPILSALGYGVKELAIKTTLGTKIKDLVSSANKLIRGVDINDEIGQSVGNMYQATTKASKELYDASTSNNPVHKVNEVLSTNRTIQNKYGLGSDSGKHPDVLGDLSAGVKKHILDTEKMAGQLLSSHQLLQNYYSARNLTTQAFKSVKNGRLNIDVANDIKQLQIAAENDLKAALKSEGNLDKFMEAKTFFQKNVVPLDDFGADEIAMAYRNREANPAAWNDATKGLFNKATSNPTAMKATLKAMDKEGAKIMERGILSDALSPILDNVDDFNFPKAFTQLNEISRTMKGTLSEETIATLEGIAKLIKEAGSQSKNISMAGHIGTIAAGGSIGGYIGQKMGGDTTEGKILGGGLGSAAGIVGLPVILMGIRQMLHTSSGQKVLMKIGSSSDGSKMSGDLIRTLYTTFLPTYIRMTKEPKQPVPQGQ